MSKVVKTVGKIAGVVAAVALVATGVGAALLPAGMTFAFGGVAVGTIATVAGAVAAGASLLLKKPSEIPSETTSRLYTNLDPNAPRKIVFGRTAMATDLRYQVYTGSQQEYLHWIVGCACHKVESIDEIWFDSDLAWSDSGGVTAKYAGYLTVAKRTEGNPSNGIAISSAWSATARLTGCAYVHLRFKLTGNSEKAQSPFASSVPTRMTIIGKGMPLPDIRVPGVDPDDQTTWVYGSSGENPALEELAYLLGWRINGQVSVGRGIPSSRIDLDSFVTAANLCDEAVALAAGGTEPRYRAAGVLSEADGPSSVLSNIEASMNAKLRDASGKLSLTVLHNDLAAPVAAFTEDDLLGDEVWKQTASLSESFNVVRGRFVDPSAKSLYQLVDYPEVSLASPDGIDRIDPFDLPMVQSAGQAQRLAKQRLQRAQYQGTYTATFNARAWQVSLGDVVSLSHPYLGWDDKLFRVAGHGVSVDGRVPMVLVEEHEDIYAWDAEESPAVEPADPTTYDPLLHPWVQAFNDSGALPGQLLWDDTFDPLWWQLPVSAEQIPWPDSRSGYAVTLPFAEGVEVRVVNAGPSDTFARTHPGEAIWVRVTADPHALLPSEEVTYGGVSVTYGGESVTYPATAEADFALEIAIEWYDANETFISRSVVATLDPNGGTQTVVGSAVAPGWGLAKLSIGYPAQSGKSGGWIVYEPWLAEYQPTADNTAESVPVMTLAPPLTLNASYTGEPTSVFPITLVNIRQHGNVDVSGETEWVATFPPGMTATINNTPEAAERGIITVTDWSGTAGGKIKVESTRNGVTLKGTIAVHVSVAPAPSGSTGSGGGTAASDSSIESTSSTSYGTPNAGPITVTAGAGGQVDLSAPLSFEMGNSTETHSAFGKWQWRVPAGVWADVASEIEALIPAQFSFDVETKTATRDPGYISVAMSKTGLTPGDPYEFRLLLRNETAGATLTYSGTASAQGL